MSNCACGHEAIDHASKGCMVCSCPARRIRTVEQVNWEGDQRILRKQMNRMPPNHPDDRCDGCGARGWSGLCYDCSDFIAENGVRF